MVLTARPTITPFTYMSALMVWPAMADILEVKVSLYTPSSWTVNFPELMSTKSEGRWTSHSVYGTGMVSSDQPPILLQEKTSGLVLFSTTPIVLFSLVSRGVRRAATSARISAFKASRSQLQVGAAVGGVVLERVVVEVVNVVDA